MDSSTDHVKLTKNKNPVVKPVFKGHGNKSKEQLLDMVVKWALEHRVVVVGLESDWKK
jgi:hypothetical protein